MNFAQRRANQYAMIVNQARNLKGTNLYTLLTRSKSKTQKLFQKIKIILHNLETSFKPVLLSLDIQVISCKMIY